jgi:RAVE protein 1 C terminal
MLTPFLGSIDMVCGNHYEIERTVLIMQSEYAAAFFLLADCLRDAVNVILNQLKDLQLAVAVTRVYEGERGPILKELLEEKVLPLAAQEGNRWLASWAFWMLHRRDMAVRALIVKFSISSAQHHSNVL